MSHRAIYVVVFNLVDLGESRIEYWLQSVQARGRGAPVILVGTHFDDKRCTDEYMSETYAYLKRKYLNRHSNIVTLLSVSTRTGRCVDEVREVVVDTALKLDYMPEEIPLRYLDVEEKLLSLRSVLPVPTQSWEEFARMCENSNVQSESLAPLATYLNDLSVLVYFRDVSRDVVVIDPQWITQMFATIVSMKANFAKGGILKKSTLPQLWRAPRHPPALHAYMLKLLKKFEVVYELNDDDLFIPCLLSNSPKQEVLAAEWERSRSAPAEQELCFGRCYKFQFVPLGFMGRLIVRFLNTFDWTPSYYWQHGIILVKPEHRLRVTLDPNTHELVLFVRGPDAGKHLLALLESIDTFVEDWLQVQVQVSVPCTRSLAGPLPLPYPRFPLKEIETSVANGNLFLFVKTPDGEELMISVTENAPDISLEDVEVPKIEYAALDLAEECGEGGYATVYHGRWSGMEVAVKKLTLNAEEDEPSKALEVFAEFRKEVAVMGHLNHRSLVRLLGVVMEPLCMVLEYMNSGSLYDYLHCPEKVPSAPAALDWATRLGVACDIASGMHFLHSAQMIHRDLKSPNVLLHGETLPDGTYYLVAKVADFGLSRNTLLSSSLKAKVVDNPTWLAPEIMGKKPYTHKSDVYSFGVILYELLTRLSFFHDVEWDWKIEEKVTTGQRPTLPECADDEKEFADFWQLMQESWHADPDKRPEFGEMRKRLRTMHSPFAAKLKASLAKAARSRRAWVGARGGGGDGGVER
jgi:Protein tyrosine and serine/threonine kinase/C-terminal of Roc, COR, domain